MWVSQFTKNPAFFAFYDRSDFRGSGQREKERKPRTTGLEDLFSRYELCNQAEGKSSDTTGWYRYIFNQFITYLKEHHYSLNLSVFNVDTGRTYVLYLCQRPRFNRHPNTAKHETISIETVRGHVRGLKAFSSWLYNEGYTKENKLKNLKPPKSPVKFKEPLSPEEIETAASCVKKNKFTGIRDHAIFMMALDNGLRASELADIELARLNLKEGYVRVMGKGSKERIVPIGKYVKTLILHYISQVRPLPA
ncbi:tyrosine-type recombinase/integrase, partial [Chloroflexota bacterium]